MAEVRIILSGLWVATMLIYLLGDVLRIFSGDSAKMEWNPTQATMMVIAVLMLVPIVMVVLSLTLKYPAIRWITIVVAVIFFILNITTLRSYPSAYDKFLLAVSLVFNAVTVWYAWQWV
jgi:predicted ferric reductase